MDYRFDNQNNYAQGNNYAPSNNYNPPGNYGKFGNNPNKKPIIFAAVGALLIILIPVLLVCISKSVAKGDDTDDSYVDETGKTSIHETAPVEITAAPVLETKTVGENDSPYKYHVTQLSEMEAEAYYMILEEIDSMPESIELPPLTEDEVTDVFGALLDDNPRLFCINRDYSYSERELCTVIYLKYYMSYDEYQEELVATDKVADRIIASLTKPNDQWQTELEIHDAIVEINQYHLDESAPENTSPYGALVEGYSCCEGYARAAKFIFDKAGIESALISGNATNSAGHSDGHMWNAVHINGAWYHLDVTWDDPSRSPYPDFDYFNVTDDIINLSHYDWDFAYPCTCMDANYHSVKGLYCTEWSYDTILDLAPLLAKELDAGQKQISIRFADKAGYDSCYSDFVNNSASLTVLEEIEPYATVTFSTTSAKYGHDDSTYTVSITPQFE